MLRSGSSLFVVRKIFIVQAIAVCVSSFTDNLNQWNLQLISLKHRSCCNQLCKNSHQVSVISSHSISSSRPIRISQRNTKKYERFASKSDCEGIETASNTNTTYNMDVLNVTQHKAHIEAGLRNSGNKKVSWIQNFRIKNQRNIAQDVASNETLNSNNHNTSEPIKTLEIRNSNEKVLENNDHRMSKKKIVPAQKKNTNSNIKTPATYNLPSMNIQKLKKQNEKDSRPLLSSLDRDAVVTVADLETILRKNEYVRSVDLKDIYPAKKAANELTSSSKSQSKSVAMPQQSVLTPQALTTGSTIVTAAAGTVIGASVHPNLWLVSSMLGAIYGQKVAKADNGNSTNIPFSLLILRAGKQVAKLYLQIWDFLQGFWFLYKTGQLSYAYYKQYETLDKKFQIQNKIDAWNTRFQEGKQNFDKWEKENEVGRKILAGLRTVWLVEENSLKKISKASYRKKTGRSKYRIVNYSSSAVRFVKRVARAVWLAITGGSAGRQELKDTISGIRLSLSTLNFEILSQRIGSGITALIALNLVGALFSAAPSFIGLVVFTIGMMFPDWLAGTYVQVVDKLQNYAEQGRGGTIKQQGWRKRKAKEVPTDGKFHYFVRENGEKRWYRTHNSMFGNKDAEEHEKKWFPFSLPQMPPLPPL